MSHRSGPLGWGQRTPSHHLGLPHPRAPAVKTNPCCKVGFDYLIKRCPLLLAQQRGCHGDQRAGPKGGRAGANYRGCSEERAHLTRLSEVGLRKAVVSAGTEPCLCAQYPLPGRTERHVATPPCPPLSPLTPHHRVARFWLLTGAMFRVDTAASGGRRSLSTGLGSRGVS